MRMESELRLRSLKLAELQDGGSGRFVAKV